MPPAAIVVRLSSVAMSSNPKSKALTLAFRGGASVAEPYANAGIAMIAAQTSQGRYRLPTACDTHRSQPPFTRGPWTSLHAGAPRPDVPRRQGRLTPKEPSWRA